MDLLKVKVKTLSTTQILLVLTTIFLIIRLVNIRLLPIFNDEATYIDWGWRMLNMDDQAFHSVIHAKTPFLMWLFGFSQNFFSDPLLAGRFVSVLFGLSAAIGIFYLSREVFGVRVAVIAFILYTFNPLFSFYDRQALMEAAIGAVGICSLYLYLKTQTNYEYKYAILLGVILGIGYFIKSNAFAFVLITGLLFTYRFFKVETEEKGELFISASVVFSTAFIIVSPLIFNSTFWESLNQNQKYILTPGEMFGMPIKIWFGNLASTLSISLIYLNAVLLLSLFGVYLAVKSADKRKYLVVVWLVSGLFITNLLAKGVTTRYIVSFLPLFVVLGGYGLYEVFNKNKVAGILSVFVLVPTFFLTLVQISNPVNYFEYMDMISPRYSEKKVYVNNWTSGYGVLLAVDYVRDKAQNKGIVVGVRLDAGNPENAVLAYFYDDDSVAATYLDSQMFSGDLSQVDCLEASVPVYYISRDSHLGGLDKYFVEEKRFYKPKSQNYVGVHILDTSCEGTKARLF